MSSMSSVPVVLLLLLALLPNLASVESKHSIRGGWLSWGSKNKDLASGAPAAATPTDEDLIWHIKKYHLKKYFPAGGHPDLDPNHPLWVGGRLEDVTTHLKDRMQKIFDETTMPDKLMVGRDYVFKAPKGYNRLEVAAVLKLRDPQQVCHGGRGGG